MPNWVYNHLISNDIEKVKQILFNKEGEVDFNRVIPMPADLKITCGSNSYEKDKGLSDTYFAKLYNNTLTQSEFVEKVKKDIPVAIIEKDYHKDCDVENIAKGFFNQKRYGYTDWYGFCNRQWGTKWNACSADDTEDSINFDTAWNMPFELLLKLSEQVSFAVGFADEDLGSNFGIYRFHNGECERLLCDNSYEDNVFNSYLACAIKGYDVDGIKEMLCEGYGEEADYDKKEIVEAVKLVEELLDKCLTN